jgi:hypothetical protein
VSRRNKPKAVRPVTWAAAAPGEADLDFSKITIGGEKMKKQWGKKKK